MALVDKWLGQRQGKLVAVEIVKRPKDGRRVLKCKCDCGNESLVDARQLETAGTRSCGCLRGETLGLRSRAKNLEGTRFGRLVVLEETGRVYIGKGRKSRANVGWLCRCDCGKEVVRSSNYLLREKGSTSCGCHVAERVKLPRNLSTTKAESYLNRLIDGAVKRKIAWELSREDALSLIKSPCFYCNRFARPPGEKRRHYPEMNGIDRKCRSGSYRKDNVVPCCSRCNFLKGKLGLDDFLLAIEEIYNNCLRAL